MSHIDRDITITYHLVTDLAPYPNNPRVHSGHQIEQIANSINQFGFTNPILIDGESMVIAGHGRLAAAIKLGLSSVPCIRLDDLTPSQVRALVIADNKLAENASWDTELLSSELIQLVEDNFDLTTLGLTEGEIKSLEEVWNPQMEPSDDFDHGDFKPDLPRDDDGEDKGLPASPKKFLVIVTLESAYQQQELFDEMNSRGYKVKV